MAAAGGLTAAAIAVAVASVAGAFGAEASPCPDGRRVLTVAAAPEIAAPVAATAADAAGGASGRAEACVDVRVTAVPPADVAAAMGDPASGVLPDVWIPDSSLWAAGAPGSAAGGRSVAWSPVVLAVPGAGAEPRGPEGPGDPAAVLGDAGLRLALADPARSAATRAGLLVLDRALSPLPDGRGRLGAAFRAADRSLPEDPEAALAAVAGDVPAAVFVPEQAVLATNARAAGTPVAAVHPTEPTPLDYPFLVLTDRAEARADAERLGSALTGPRWLRRVQAAGFRPPDGTPAPDPDDVDRAVAAFDAVTLGTRMLAVVDVSGSMAARVPGRPPRTRIDLAVGAAANGLALYPDDAQVGLWVFSTSLTPGADHRELVPIGPLGMQPDGVRGRERLAAALSTVTAVPDGDTGLYDTVLAAVRAVRQGWEAGRVNSVVVLTDGRNDDDDGIPLEQLLTVLQQEAEDRPVPVIGIALGEEGDAAALREIGRVTAGETYEVRDVRTVHQVLADALAHRPCRPDC